MRTGKLVLLAPAAVAALVLASCSSTTPTAAPTTTTSTSVPKAKAAATPTDSTTTTVALVPATCAALGSNAVQCKLPNVQGRPYFVLPTLLSEASAAAPSLGLSATSTMVVTAFGAAGAKGYKAAAGSPGSKGKGGMAQATTTIARWQAAYGSPVLFYYLGAAGVETYQTIWKGGVGGLGGASTIVSPANLTSSATPPVLGCVVGTTGTQYNEPGCSATNILLVAGGGGGGGEGATCNGGNGGNGGTAVSATAGPATGPGQDAQKASCSGGHAGKGGDQGNHGDGGKGGNGLTSKHGAGGNDGVGGMGGPVHAKNGGSSPTMPWTNVGYCMYQMGDSGTKTYPCPVAQTTSPNYGKGGKGQWRGGSQPVGGGGGGGGGWGGGGGGGGGGNSYPGGGGGGGGSFAAQSTVTTPAFTAPPNPGGTGAVYVTFVS